MMCEKKKEKNRRLTLVPIGGLGNRIMAITSAIDFCRKQKLRLCIYWFKDWGMGANFHDLFKLRGNDVDIKVVDAQWFHLLYDRPRKKNLWFPLLYQHFVFDTCLYEQWLAKEDNVVHMLDRLKKSNKPYLVYWSKIPGLVCDLDYLVPAKLVKKLVQEQIVSFSANTVGVHIRRTDHALAITNSPLSWFIEKMEGEIKFNPDVKFYVASDSLIEKKKLIDCFCNRIITMVKEVDRSSKQGIIEGLAEIYLLAATSKIYGSYNSSFSVIASWFGKIPLFVK